LILLACAVREPPPGGPEDKTPPSIIDIKPENGSTNLPKDAVFKIRFSESMNRDQIEGAIFLSPVFWNYPRFEWSGRELTIVPPENLRANTTYILTIGADAADAHGVKSGHSQSYAFSTGPSIDSGAIAGTVFFGSSQRVFYDIWVYAWTDTVIDFAKRIPDYVTQVDSAGAFAVEHLSSGRYLVICIQDNNDDLFWDPASDAIGLPPSLYELGTGGRIGGVVFRPAPMDTAIAYISGVNPVNDRRIKIEFSSPPDESLKLNPENYQVRYFDGDSLLATGIVYESENGQLILETNPLEDGVIYRLFVSNLRTKTGNRYDSSGVRFTGIDIPDTIGPMLLSTFPPDGSSSAYQDSVIEMTFSERLLTLPFPEAVTIIADSTDTLRFAVAWPKPNMARLRVLGEVSREREITVELNPSRILDISRNRTPDSIITFLFRLPPADTVGTVTASIEPGGAGYYIGILAPMSRGETYQAQFDASGKMTMSAVMPGNYRFEFFEDADSNSKWSSGSIIPLKFPEPFSFLPDTIQVRSRWEMDIGTVKLP
jgi:hypothetical protein